jgi:hypothetical protein
MQKGIFSRCCAALRTGHAAQGNGPLLLPFYSALAGPVHPSSQAYLSSFNELYLVAAELLTRTLMHSADRIVLDLGPWPGQEYDYSLPNKAFSAESRMTLTKFLEHSACLAWGRMENEDISCKTAL